MAQIFFKKRDRKASAWATLGFTTLLIAAVIFGLAGPIFQIEGLRSFWADTTVFLIRYRLLTAGLILVAAGAVFTLFGTLHSAFSPRVRLSWRGVLAIALVGLLGWPMGHAYRRIHEAIPRADISTNPANPPAFLAIRVPAALATPGAEAPRFVALMSPLSPTALANKAVGVAKALGWRIVKSDTGRGRFEAVVQDRWFGVHAMVVVRVTTEGASSRLDIRAVSATDGGRWGLNVALMREFLDKMAA